MNSNNKINAAIQLLPLETTVSKYSAVDKAIALIADSGLNYKVCPFETVVEGSSENVYALIQNIQSTMLSDVCSEIIINIKIHAATRDLTFDEKLGKY